MNDSTLVRDLFGEPQGPGRGARGRTPAHFPLWSYGLAALAFAFVIGFGARSDPAAAKVFLALAAAVAAVASLALVEIFFSLRGRRASSLARALPSHAALEEEKRQVLTAIKELDFDRSMNKVDQADFEQMRARYEREALRVLKSIDEEQAMWRARAEALVAKTLGTSGVAVPKESAKQKGATERSSQAAAPRDEPGVLTEAGAAGTDTRVRCSGCDTPNEADASFCKRCGTKLAAKRMCDACKVINEADADFCTGCGAPFGKGREA